MKNNANFKNQILTIPNLLSLFRIILIPFIVWSYFTKESSLLTVGLIVLSGITDVIDGIIARKFNMVSNFGKVFDPIADKLTQATLIICLTLKFPLMISLIILFAVKEVTMGIMGLVSLKKHGKVNSAKWYGKANTVLLYLVMGLLILFPQINGNVANILIIVCHLFEVFALCMYARFYRLLTKQQMKKNNTEGD